MSHTDCRSDVGITVGLIDGIITICRVLVGRNLDNPAIAEALDDLTNDESVVQIFGFRSNLRTALAEWPLENTKTIQPVQTYRVTVWLHKTEGGTIVQEYTTETRQWWDAVTDIMSWLRIEVLPYWKPGDLMLSWDVDNTDMRLSGALYGMAVSHALQPAWLPKAPEAWEPYPDMRGGKDE